VPGKPGTLNIVEIAAAVNGQSGEFSYLLGAVGCLTDSEGNNPVVSLLSGEDKLTLFAPTDEAFKALQRALGVPAGSESPAITCTLGDAVVADVLSYHVTDGRRFANSVFNARNSKMLEMLNGQYVVTNPGAKLNDAAGQTISVVLDPPGLFNINASNGVIHVVDTVLLPFAP
jgi:transforming growth factor-beta-induced protein